MTFFCSRCGKSIVIACWGSRSQQYVVFSLKIILTVSSGALLWKGPRQRGQISLFNTYIHNSIQPQTKQSFFYGFSTNKRSSACLLMKIHIYLKYFYVNAYVLHIVNTQTFADYINIWNRTRYLEHSSCIRYNQSIQSSHLVREWVSCLSNTKVAQWAADLWLMLGNCS